MIFVTVMSWLCGGKILVEMPSHPHLKHACLVVLHLYLVDTPSKTIIGMQVLCIYRDLHHFGRSSQAVASQLPVSMPFQVHLVTFLGHPSLVLQFISYSSIIYNSYKMVNPCRICGLMAILIHGSIVESTVMQYIYMQRPLDFCIVVF